METNEEEVYTLVIPVKPEKDRPHRYNAGEKAGIIEEHKEFLDKNKGEGVFWSWGLSNHGLKNRLKYYLPDLLKELGSIKKINGKNVKINNIGYFYSTKQKSINWEFEATCIVKKEVIEGFSKYENLIPDFRKNVYENDTLRHWMLIRKLKELKQPFRGEKIQNYYEFSNFLYYSRQKNLSVKFNTNHLISGNAFVIKVEK